jgi:hypothetical protein
MSQRRGLVLAFSDVSVEAFHESKGVRIVGAPQARHDSLGTAHEKGFDQVGNSFFALQLSDPGITSGERHQVGVKVEAYDFVDLQ